MDLTVTVIANDLANVYCLAQDDGKELKFLRSNGDFVGIMSLQALQTRNRIIGFRTAQEAVRHADQHGWVVSNRLTSSLSVLTRASAICRTAPACATTVRVTRDATMS